MQFCIWAHPGRPQYDAMKLERSIRHLLNVHPSKLPQCGWKAHMRVKTVKLRLFKVNLQNKKYCIRQTALLSDVLVANYLHFSMMFK